MHVLPIIALAASTLSLASARSIDQYSGNHNKPSECEDPKQDKDTIKSPEYGKCIEIKKGAVALWSRPGDENYEVFLYSDKDCKKDEYNLGYTDMCTLIGKDHKYLNIKHAGPK